MTNDEDASQHALQRARMTADIAAAYVSNNAIAPGDIAGLIQSVFSAMADMEAVSNAPKQEPAVPVSRSVKDDYIICLEDGARLKMLKRYIRTRFGLSPDEYRVKWGLPASYPMVAPAYSRRRSDFAKKIGLGKGRRNLK